MGLGRAAVIGQVLEKRARQDIVVDTVNEAATFRADEEVVALILDRAGAGGVEITIAICNVAGEDGVADRQDAVDRVDVDAAALGREIVGDGDAVERQTAGGEDAATPVLEPPAVGVVARDGAVRDRHRAAFAIDAAAQGGPTGRRSGNVAGDGARIDHQGAPVGDTAAAAIHGIPGDGASVQRECAIVADATPALERTIADRLAAGYGQVVHGHDRAGLDGEGLHAVEAKHVDTVLPVHLVAATLDDHALAADDILDGRGAFLQGDVSSQPDGEDAAVRCRVRIERGDGRVEFGLGANRGDAAAGRGGGLRRQGQQQERAQRERWTGEPKGSVYFFHKSNLQIKGFLKVFLSSLPFTQPANYCQLPARRSITSQPSQ